LRIPWPSRYRNRALQPAGDGRGVQDGITREVISGIKVMFYGRMVVTALLALWVLPLPADRSLIYLAALLGFGALGLPSYLLARQGRVVPAVFAAFIVLDACLLAYALIVPPPFFVEGWTAQLNLRLPNVVFLGIFIASTALSELLPVSWTGS